MRRLASIVIVIGLIAILSIPVQAKPVGFKSGDLVVKLLEETPGAAFRHKSKPEEVYVFRVPVIAEFYDQDGSGNFTMGDPILGIAKLRGLSLTIEVLQDGVNITRKGNVYVVGSSGISRAYVEIYLTISNSTANEAKRGMEIQRPRVSENDSLSVLVIFAAVDRNMTMQSCSRKHENHVGPIHNRGKVEMRRGATKAEVEFEAEARVDGVNKPVNVTAFTRGDKRGHTYGIAYKAHIASQVVFPYGSTIVYDPVIKISTITGFLKSPYSITAIIVAILLVVGAIAVVLKNNKR